MCESTGILDNKNSHVYLIIKICNKKIISFFTYLKNRTKYLNYIDNMATITKLANAIDDFLDNRAIHIDILSDQIKRMTRQIRQKENNLHQNLVCEQRRHYDAEAKRDNKII